MIRHKPVKSLHKTKIYRYTEIPLHSLIHLYLLLSLPFFHHPLLNIYRFSFLDFKEYNTDDSSAGVSPSASPYTDRLSVDLSSAGSPTESPISSRRLTKEGGHSPLLQSSHAPSQHQLVIQNDCSSSGSMGRSQKGHSPVMGRPVSGDRPAQPNHSSSSLRLSCDSGLESCDSHVENS